MGEVQSMKVPGPRHQVAEQRGLVAQPPGDEMHDLALALERTEHGEQTRAQQLLALSLGEIAPNDDVDHASLVLERDEGDAARRAGALATGNESGDADDASVRQRFQLCRGEHALTLQALA